MKHASNTPHGGSFPQFGFALNSPIFLGSELRHGDVHQGYHPILLQDVHADRAHHRRHVLRTGELDNWAIMKSASDFTHARHRDCGTDFERARGLYVVIKVRAQQDHGSSNRTHKREADSVADNMFGVCLQRVGPSLDKSRHSLPAPG